MPVVSSRLGSRDKECPFASFTLSLGFRQGVMDHRTGANASPWWYMDGICLLELAFVAERPTATYGLVASRDVWQAPVWLAARRGGCYTGGVEHGGIRCVRQYTKGEV